jgi:hypothetical protein
MVKIKSYFCKSLGFIVLIDRLYYHSTNDTKSNYKFNIIEYTLYGYLKIINGPFNPFCIHLAHQNHDLKCQIVSNHCPLRVHCLFRYMDVTSDCLIEDNIIIQNKLSYANINESINLEIYTINCM